IQIGLDAGGAVISAAPAPAVIGAPGGCNPPVANTVLCNVAWMPGPLAVDFSTDALYPDGGGATLIGCFAPCGPADNFGPVSIPGPGTTTPPSPPSTPPPPTPPPTPPP